MEATSGGSDPLLALIASLAVGAHAVGKLPKGSSSSSNNSNRKGGDDEDDDTNHDDDDEFSFQMAFLEFRTLIGKARKRIADIVQESLDVVSSSSSSSGSIGKEEYTNPSEGTRDLVTNLYSTQMSLLMAQNKQDESSSITIMEEVDWDKCKDICEHLLEDIEQYISSQRRKQELISSSKTTTEEQEDNTNITTNKTSKQQPQHKFKTIISNVCTIEKSQVTYNFQDEIIHVINSRTIPFQPKLTTKPFAMVPLSTSTLPGHGLSLSTNNKMFDEAEQKLLIAPNVHYPHPYETEIQQFVPCPWQLQPPVRDRTIVTDGSSSHCFDEFTWDTIPQEGIGGTLRKGTSQLKDSSSLVSSPTIIDTEDALRHLVAQIETHQIREIAIDLEAHSYRSFLGFVCLMQLSVRWPTTSTNSGSYSSSNGNTASSAERGPSSSSMKNDIIIDTLALRKLIGPILLPIFVNPNICKIMHGADSDVLWLQRDFGIYIVNLFDTHQAAIELSLPSRSLASLLQRYAHVTVDKAHQLSDWRQRPLPLEMIHYAQSDTHYLIDIYDIMRRDLVRVASVSGATSPSSGILHVLNQSRQICLKRCNNEPFHPLGWKKLLWPKKNVRKVQHHQQQQQQQQLLNEQQQQCLSMLWDWRDTTARKHDESNAYVCQNHILVRIAQMQPKSLSELTRLVSPMPELVKMYASEFIDFVQQSSKSYTIDSRGTTTGTSSIQTTTVTTSSNQIDYDIQPNAIPFLLHNSTASAQLIPPGGTSSDEQESDAPDELLPSAKRRRTLETNPHNADFICTNYTPHSLELNSSLLEQGRGVVIDGAIQFTKNDNDNQDVSSKERIESIKIANKIRLLLEGDKNLLNLATPATFDFTTTSTEEEKTSTVSCDDKDLTASPPAAEEIPLSLKEAYKVSDRKTDTSYPSSSDRKRQQDSMKAVDSQKQKDLQQTKNDGSITKSEAEISSVIEPYDYSKHKSVGLFLNQSVGAGLSTNPFFSGAAATLASNNELLGKKKKGGSKEKGEKKSSKYIDRAPKVSSEKSFVYRSDGR